MHEVWCDALSHVASTLQVTPEEEDIWQHVAPTSPSISMLARWPEAGVADPEDFNLPFSTGRVSFRRREAPAPVVVAGFAGVSWRPVDFSPARLVDAPALRVGRPAPVGEPTARGDALRSSGVRTCTAVGSRQDFPGIVSTTPTIPLCRLTCHCVHAVPAYQPQSRVCAVAASGYQCPTWWRPVTWQSTHTLTLPCRAALGGDVSREQPAKAARLNSRS